MRTLIMRLLSKSQKRMKTKPIMSQMTDDEGSSIADGTREALVSLLQVKHDLIRSTTELSQHMDAACKHLEIAQDIISRTEEVTGKLYLSNTKQTGDFGEDYRYSSAPLCFKRKLLACSALSFIFLVLFNVGIRLGADSEPLQHIASRMKKASTEYLATGSQRVGPSDLVEEATLPKFPQNMKEKGFHKMAVFSTGDNKNDDALKDKDWLDESTYPPGEIPTSSDQGSHAGFETRPPGRVDMGTGLSFLLLRGVIISVHRNVFSWLKQIRQPRGDTINGNENVAVLRSPPVSTIVRKEVNITSDSDNVITANSTSRQPATTHSSSPPKTSYMHRSIFHKENNTTFSGGPLINVVPTRNVRRRRALSRGDCDEGDVAHIVNVRILVDGLYDEFQWALYNMSGSVVAHQDPVRVGRQDPVHVARHYGASLPWYNYTSTICISCHDQEEHCSTWAKDNRCATNSSYMLKHCSRSCHACECFTLEIATASQHVLVGEYDVEIEGVGRKRGEWNNDLLTKIGKGCKVQEQVECGKKPLLAPDSEYTSGFSDPEKRRIHDILNVVVSISGRTALVDVNSAQYKAACWILYDDALVVSAKSITLVQRYVLAVHFFATNGDKWEHTYDFLSPRQECTWNWLLARNVDWGGTYDKFWGDWLAEWKWRVAGVSCNNSSKVERIFMVGNNLEGTIVSELSKLGYLEGLTLADNNLQGLIPPELGALSNLSHLHLQNNNLQGSLPSDLFQATQLVELNIQHNSIFGSLSTYVGNLPKLKILQASDNSLVGHIPESIYDLDSLTQLQLRNNSFNGTISGSIGQFSSLLHCDLSMNNLTGSIPPQIGELVTLERLDLAGNRLAFNIPAEINNLGNITELDFSDNLLIGRIPFYLTNLIKLKGLHLSVNSLSGPIPSSIGALSMIEKIELFANGLTGQVPRSFALLTNLETLRLEHNDLHGEIPDDLCSNFTRMQRNQSDDVENWQLYYSADCLGYFSSKAVSCPCCTSCYGPTFFRNRIGPCPDGSVETSVHFQNEYEFYGIRWSLRNGFGNDVQLGGPYSPTTSRHAHSTCIASTDCYTFRSYPGKYRESMFHNVSHDGRTIDTGRSNLMNFGYSSVTKTLSKDTCDPIVVCGQIEPGGPQRSERRAMFDTLVFSSGLEMLSHSDSAQHKAACWLINDDIKKPDARYGFFLQRYVLALLHFQTKAWATHSQKQAPPASDECDWGGILCNQEGYVIEIDLSKKYLDGSLPRELGEIRSLEALHLGMNQLHGSVPTELSNLWRLRKLELGRNSLQGPIPSQLAQISNLVVLDLSRNKLSGNMPSEIFLLSHLTFLDVSNNNLHGSITSEIRSLSNLGKCHHLRNKQFKHALSGGLLNPSLTDPSLHLRCHIYLGAFKVFLDGSSNFFTSSIPTEMNLATNLAHLDLSSNEITGKLPQGGLGSSNLRHVYLHTNRLSGDLGPALFQGSKLETIMLQNNELTGSIPETLGESTNLSAVSFSYNSFKGSVPKTLENLAKLQLLHLHGNHLTGTINVLQSLDSFITDCGSPSTTAASKIACKSCTECCNSDGQCQRPPPKKLSVLNGGLLMIVVPLVSMVGISLAGMLCVKRKLLHLPVLNSSAQILCGEDSTYSLVLASSYLGWMVSFVTVLLQAMMFGVFILAADFDESASDWVYTMRCPPNSLECEDNDGKTPFGWAIFSILIAASLVPDIADGIRLMYKSVSLMSFRCLIGGAILVCITALAVYTSVVYNAAIAQTDVSASIPRDDWDFVEKWTWIDGRDCKCKCNLACLTCASLLPLPMPRLHSANRLR